MASASSTTPNNIDLENLKNLSASGYDKFYPTEPQLAARASVYIFGGEVSASSNHTLTSHMKQDEQPQAVFAEHSLLPLAPPNRRWHQHRQRPFVPVLCRIKSSAMTEWIPGFPHPFQGQLFHHHHDDREHIGILERNVVPPSLLLGKGETEVRVRYERPLCAGCFGTGGYRKTQNQQTM